jgi:hypothetical protein
MPHGDRAIVGHEVGAEVETFVYRFTASQLRAIPRRHLGFLIASGHCCNELAVLLPYIIFEHEIAQANETETAFILTRKFTIDRVLISKIVEYGDFCTKFFSAADSTSDPFAAELAKDYEPISAELKSAKWARILRNKVSFHYDREHASAAIESLDGDHPLKILAGKIKGVTLFDFAEEIVIRPVFEAAGNGDIGEGMDVAHKFIVTLVNSITSFHARAAKQLLRPLGMMTNYDRDTLRDQYCAAPGEIAMPISISSAYVEAVKSKR